MTLQDRILRLTQSGLGMDERDVAAIIGIEVADVRAVLADASHAVTLPGGGASIQSALIQDSGPSVVASPSALFPWSTVPVVHDDIGVVFPTEGEYVLLPAGYYSGVISMGPLVVEHGLGAGLSTDPFRAMLLAQDVTSGISYAAHSDVLGSAFDGGAPSVAWVFLTLAFTLETGAADVHTEGFAEHAFGGFASFLSVASLAVARPGPATDVTAHNPSLYLQRIGDKA